MRDALGDGVVVDAEQRDELGDGVIAEVSQDDQLAVDLGQRGDRLVEGRFDRLRRDLILHRLLGSGGALVLTTAAVGAQG